MIKKKVGSRNYLIGLGLAFLVGLAVFGMNYSVPGPMIQADEGSYLANAAAIAGFYNDIGGSYHAGYSFLIAPAFWIGDSPESVWLAVKAINASLVFVMVVTLWWLAGRLSSDITQQFFAVAVVSLYPAWIVLAGYSFSQVAFATFFTITFASLVHSARGYALWSIGAGISCGFLYWIHPTGIVPVFALFTAGIYLWLKQRHLGAGSCLLLSAAAMVFVYRYGIAPWLQDRMTISGHEPTNHYPSPFRILSPLVTVDGLKEVVFRTAGHVFYLTTGTVGLLWVGLIPVRQQVRSRSEPSTNVVHEQTTEALFLSLSLLGTVALSVLLFSTLPEANRLNHWMYGRYAEGVIAPILLFGVLSFPLRKTLISIPIAVTSAALLSLRLDGFNNIAFLNIPALWQVFTLQKAGLWAWMVSGCALITLVATVPRYLALATIAVVFSFSSFLQIQWHTSAAHNETLRWTAAMAVRKQFPPGTCVGFDHSGIDSHEKHVFWFDFGFILYDYQLKRMSLEKWLTDCDGPLFSYDEQLAGNSNSHPIALSGLGGPTAWAKGLPPDPSYPITVADFSPALASILGAGWHNLERAHVWSGKEALLYLPVPKDCIQDMCSAVLMLSVYGASPEREVKVTIVTDADDVKAPDPLIIRNSSQHRVIVPISSAQATQALEIRVPNAISPKEFSGSPDSRVLGVALHSIDLLRSSQVLHIDDSH